jgi:hypothetical protein
MPMRVDPASGSCRGRARPLAPAATLLRAVVGAMMLPAVGTALAADAGMPTYPAMAPLAQYLMPDAQAEIALARSAAPPSISADAGVLVLGEHGYRSAVPGRNGFVCLVERSWDAAFDDPGFWNPRIRGPDCFNPQAARSVLPQFLKRTEWILAGADKAKLLENTRAAFASHQFVEPEAGSLSFMLSRQGYLGDDAGGPWKPHVMFFIGAGRAQDWAAGRDASPILGSDGGPLVPTVLFVPVTAWSDGSPAAASSGAHRHSP